MTERFVDNLIPLIEKLTDEEQDLIVIVMTTIGMMPNVHVGVLPFVNRQAVIDWLWCAAGDWRINTQGYNLKALAVKLEQRSFEVRMNGRYWCASLYRIEGNEKVRKFHIRRKSKGTATARGQRWVNGGDVKEQAIV